VRIGLIARADARGLGVQTKAFHDQMHPARTLVVDCPSLHPLPIRTDWYPGATWVHGLPTADDLDVFCEGLDVVYTAETGYGHALWDIAERRGVRTVLHANYEFLNLHDRPTVWAAPSPWNIDRWPPGTVHLPVPVETERFPEFDPPPTASHLLHIVGRPTVDGHRDLHRNGTIDLLSALQHVASPVTVTLRCQQHGYLDNLISQHAIPPNVTLCVESGDTPDYWANYRGQHAMILPRRFGGLCLPANESIGAGIPVIMTDIDPNNTWLPRNWLVHAHYAGEFRAKQMVQTYRADEFALAAIIDRIATDSEFYRTAVDTARALRDSLSWEALRPRYEQVMAG
jgi:glycosyltransferase involved in cell wall biosynthesis